MLNRIPKQDNDKTPYGIFTRTETDFMRDFRVEWGEPVVVKKPKGIASDLKVTGQWGVVVRQIMNRAGVLKVYLIQSKKYAYRLHFMRAVAPEWVMESLNEMNSDMKIGFEEDSISEEQDISDVLQPIKEAEDACKNMAVKDEVIKDEEDQEESKVQTEGEEEELSQELQSGHYVTRFGQVSRPPVRLMESTYAVMKETYHQNFYEGCDNKAKDTVDCTYSMKKALLFDKAVVARPEEGMKALKEEVIKAIKSNIWHPVHLKDLSKKEQE